MRDGDRIALCEAHPEERDKLVAALGHDSRLSIAGTDGYLALNAWLPPKERRGLVLIDPPFEEPDEPSASSRRWRGPCANGRPACSSPGGRSATRRPTRMSSTTSPPSASPGILRIEIDVGPGRSARTAQRPLSGAGLLVVNPPHTLIERSPALMPWLAGLMARDGRGASVCAWLTPPRRPRVSDSASLGRTACDAPPDRLPRHLDVV